MDAKYEYALVVFPERELQLFDLNVAHTRCDLAFYKFPVILEQDKQPCVDRI